MESLLETGVLFLAWHDLSKPRLDVKLVIDSMGINQIFSERTFGTKALE